MPVAAATQRAAWMPLATALIGVGISATITMALAAALGPSLRWGTRSTKVRNNIAHDGQRMFVILRDMIDDARFAAMQIAAA